MAFRCIKSSVLFSVEKLVYTATFNGNGSLKRPVFLPCTSAIAAQRRSYRKFNRIPLAVNPAKQDEGKMSMKDYVTEKCQEVNQEVIEEARRVSEILQDNKSSYYVTGDAHHSDEENTRHPHLHDDNAEYTAMPNPQSKPRKNSNQRRKYVEEDSEIRRAIRSIHPKDYETAHPEYRKLLTKCNSAKSRDLNNVVMLEGPKLIREAIAAGLAPAAVFQSRKKLLLEMMPLNMDMQEKLERLSTYNLFATPYKTLNTWSSVVKGQGIIAVFELSEAASAPRLCSIPGGRRSNIVADAGVTVLLDGIREPGNLGAILRTVAAVGAQKVVLMKGCCDPWESKALRAGCGGHFSLSIVKGVCWSAVYNEVSPSPRVFLADVCNSDREAMTDGDLKDEDDYDEETGVFVDDAEVIAKKKFQRKLMVQKYFAEREVVVEKIDEDAVNEDDEDRSHATSGITVEADEDGNEFMYDNTFNDEEHVSKFSNVDLPKKLYNEIDFFPQGKVDSSSVVLVIGSETGVSNSAKKFTADNYGHQVSIPLFNNIDSLNTSVANGVIMYEIWNQAQEMRRRTLVDDEKTENIL